MATEDVNIKVSANVAEAIRLWKAMEDGPKGMANELDAMGSRGQRAAKGLNAEVGKMIGQFATITAGIDLATKALMSFMASQKEAADREGTSTRTADRQSRGLANLAPGKAIETIRNDTLDMAIRRRVTSGQATDAAGALLGAGYEYDEVMKRGGAGDAALKTLAATNAAGKNVDVKSLIDSLTGFLDASGQQKTAANLEAAGKASQSMFASNKMEIADLQALAPKAKSIYEDTKLQNEQIAILSMFKDVTSADIGSTSFKTGISRLVGAGNVKERTRALGELGLKPEDVDFQGESFADVQQRMAEGFQRVGDKAPRLKNQIFGDEGKLAADVLFSPEGVALYQQRLAESRNSADFNRAVNITEGGYEAKANAQEAKTVKKNFKEGMVDANIARDALLNKMADDGAWAPRRWLTEVDFDTMYRLTNNAQTALTHAANGYGMSQQDRQQILSESSPDPVKVEVQVTVSDQNQVAIPHEANVSQVGKNAAPQSR